VVFQALVIFSFVGNAPYGAPEISFNLLILRIYSLGHPSRNRKASHTLFACPLETARTSLGRFQTRADADRGGTVATCQKWSMGGEMGAAPAITMCSHCLALPH